MIPVPRFVILRLIRIHEYLIQNYLKILLFSALAIAITGMLQWISLNQPNFLVRLNDNLKEFPLGVTFGILTVVLIATLLLYALHLESVEKSHFRSRNVIRTRYVDFIVLCLCAQVNDATERLLGQSTVTQDQLDAMHAEIEDCMERFRESARKLLNAPPMANLQELENYFRLTQPGCPVGEEILKLKRSSKPLLSEQAIKELLS
ncbi:uncharacterized protein LOC135702309 [Ochlerotatus camptorhynchus]|uniref:uncharacterized protein LOC135702309 n=1 Tax=Ochlerotatus camptorhynchus TaxID=644619 RepID=UPI0031D14B51